MIVTAPNHEPRAGAVGALERRHGVDRRGNGDRRDPRGRRSGADPLEDLGLPRLVELRSGSDRRSGAERRCGVDRRRARTGFITPWQLPDAMP